MMKINRKQRANAIGYAYMAKQGGVAGAFPFFNGSSASLGRQYRSSMPQNPTCSRIISIA
jgi:hypothetical protein